MNRIRLALLLTLTALAGCELCQAMPPEMAEACMRTIPRAYNCDYNGDGVGDIDAPCESGMCYPPPGPGVCV